jgi:hypothetical protein
MNGLNPVYTISILILPHKMNTEKKVVCYQVYLQQLELYVELTCTLPGVKKVAIQRP